MIEKIFKSLNDPQKDAVSYDDGSMLVLAGAGSGKTKVLTTRIVWLISSGRVNTGSILAVTFTNKASKEMLLRVSSLVPYNLRGMWIGTFHGLCNRMLRMHHKDAALPESFQILDIQDQLSSIKRLMKIKKIDPEIIIPKDVQKFINSAKEQGLRAKDIDDSEGFNRKYIDLYDSYDDQCQREGVVDFGELLLRSLELLQRNNELRLHYQNRFKHILIDEFQDTNALQYAWIKLLSNKDPNVFAVGDDDQSIYGFRGADVSNMERFRKEFKVKNIIRLEQNYRSYGYILDAANALIKNNNDRLGKNLWTDSGMGDQIKVVEALDDSFEANWLVDEISSLIRSNVCPSEIAILYRSNAQSRVLEHQINKRGISYRVYGGFRFYDRAEIKHALAYLRLIENSNDDTAFLRIVNFPPRKIGAKSVETLQQIAGLNGCSLYESISYAEGKLSKNIKLFYDLIEKMRLDSIALPLAEMVDLVIKNSGLLDYYASERDGSERLENLKELVTAASGFLSEEKIDTTIPSDFGIASEQDQNLNSKNNNIIEEDLNVDLNLSPLTKFLTHASLESGESQAEVGKEAIQLMTVHSAKGLEYDVIFITGLEEGLFPHENSLIEVDGLEEERRLMYVAITRAKKQLYFSFAQMRKLYGQFRYHKRSRFIEEIPNDNLKWVFSAQQNLSSSSDVSLDYLSNQKNQTLLSDNFYSNSVSSGVSDKSSIYKIGKSVHHNKFGNGVILNLEGLGSDARAEVKFENNGTKWLALSIAKLNII